MGKMKIGKRLTFGFGAILLLVLAMAWQMHRTMKEVENNIGEPLRIPAGTVNTEF